MKMDDHIRSTVVLKRRLSPCKKARRISKLVIFTRVLGLQQSRKLDIKDVLTYELSPVAAALFDEHGHMRSQAKSSLKKKLEVDAHAPDAVIIDGCALLWAVHWPVSGCIENFLDYFIRSLMYHLKASDVYL